MNTRDKLQILNQLLNGEELIASVGGHMTPVDNHDPIARTFSVMTTQEWGNSDHRSTSDDTLVKNVYMGITDKHLYIIFLDTYHPDIVRETLTIPMEQVRWKYSKAGFRNIVGMNIGNDYMEFVIPGRKELTGLEDQKEEANEFMSYAEGKVLEQNKLWASLMNR